MTVLLQVENATRHYRLPRAHLFAPAPVVHALQGVGFTLQAGRSLGVVGESGSGKSTLARLVMALERPTAGRVLLQGRDLNALPAAELRRARADFQMVFQDPFGSLDPRLPVGRTVAEPLAAQGALPAAAMRERAGEMLDAVGLRAADASKYPHEFSGGQRQRIAIARALVTRPKLIVADEPVSALDVSVQAQVLNLMQDLQDKLGVTYLFISHDLAVVDLVCDEVLVLYQGRVVEHGDPDTLFRAAAHPYTRTLLAAVPNAQPGARRRHGRAPEDHAAAASGAARAAPATRHKPATSLTPAASATPAAPGCAFAPRCAFRQDRCLAELPLLRPSPTDRAAAPHSAACHEAERVLSTHPATEPR